MKKRDKAARAAPMAKTEPARGILHGTLPPSQVGPERYPPSPDLAPFIEHFWAVRWNREGLAPQRVATLLGGPCQSRFSRLLTGNSFVFKVKFRPASFHTFYRQDVSSLMGRTLPPANVLGSALAKLDAAVLAAETHASRVAPVEDFLRSLKPRQEPEATLAHALIATIVDDRTVTRVEQLADRARLPPRTLQRLFRRFVGLSPKWIIARYRLQDALECEHAGSPGGWANVVLELGYADQAHFIRDLKALVGKTPRAYQASKI